jgi:hypothetical protein
MGAGATVGIVIAALAAWILIMLVIGKWRTIGKWFKAAFSLKVSGQGDA